MKDTTMSDTFTAAATAVSVLPILLPALTTMTSTPPKKRYQRGPTQATKAIKFITRTMKSGRIQWTWTELAEAVKSDAKHLSANILSTAKFKAFMDEVGLVRWGTQKRAFGLVLMQPPATQQSLSIDAD